jgi:hypothetical protein
MQQLLDRLNVVKTLQCAIVVLTVIYVIGAVWPMIATLMNSPFTFKLLMLNILGLAMRLASSAFNVLVLLGLVELIKMKQLGR